MMLELERFDPNRTIPSSVAAVSMAIVTKISIPILRLLTISRRDG